VIGIEQAKEGTKPPTQRAVALAKAGSKVRHSLGEGGKRAIASICSSRRRREDSRSNLIHAHEIAILLRLKGLYEASHLRLEGLCEAMADLALDLALLRYF